MDEKQFFDWLRSQQSDGRLTQDMVDGAKELLLAMTPELAQESLSKINGWSAITDSVLMQPIPNAPRLTKADIVLAANSINVEPAMLKALSDIESKGGFNVDGSPKILFERHKFYQALTNIKWFTMRNQMMREYPDICNNATGGYNARPQYEKLRIAATLNWDAAHESASWGAFQIMGYHWRVLGYESIVEFVMRMYVSEQGHLEALCRFIKANSLDKPMRDKDWAKFSRGYNGKGYKKNDYDNRLAKAYAKAKKDGW